MVAGLVLLVTAVFVVVRDDGPRRIVALPAADASPAEVVRGYVDALDAHDFDTAGRLLTPGQRRQVAQTWFEDVDTITHLEVGEASPEDPEWSGQSPEQQVMRVPVRFTVGWRWLHNDGSVDEGPTTWGYLPVRDDPSDPWRISGEGTG